MPMPRNRAIILAMDVIDRKILAELQAQGRLTVTELAQRVALSVPPSPTRRRAPPRAPPAGDEAPVPGSGAPGPAGPTGRQGARIGGRFAVGPRASDDPVWPVPEPAARTALLGADPSDRLEPPQVPRRAI